MKKELLSIEYVFDKVSKNILWNHLTTPQGLSGWFADDVLVNENTFTFFWNKNGQEAEMIEMATLSSIRFRWLDEEDEDAYFEFRIHTIEVTGAVALEIIDFVEPDEREQSLNLWDAQIKTLKRMLGM